VARPKIKTVRASTHPLGTGDFTTIQAWEDFADDKINPYQWAECFSGFNLGVFSLSGWSSTPTSSGYPRIFASSGEPHAGGSFNHGPVIAMPSGTTSSNSIGVSYAQVDGIGSTRGFHINLDTASNVTVENCWATAENNTCFKAKSSANDTASSGHLIRNCLAIGTNKQDVGFELGGEEMLGGKPGIRCYNCTSYGLKNVGFRIYNSKAPGFYGGADVDVRNCISSDSEGADFAFIAGGDGDVIFQTNMSSDTTSTTIGQANYSQQPSNNVFVNPDKALFTYQHDSGLVKVVSSGDFRLRENSFAVDGGQDLPEVIRDIRGIRRPYNARTDIGAYEYGFWNRRFNLFISGPVPVNSGIRLHMQAIKEKPASGYVNLFAQSLGPSILSSGVKVFAQSLGPGTPSSGVRLFAQSLGPISASSGIRLFAQSQGFSPVNSGIRFFAKSEGPIKASGQPTLYAQSTGFTTVSSGVRLYAKALGSVSISSGIRMFAQSLGPLKASGHPTLALLGFLATNKMKLSTPGHKVESSGVRLFIGSSVPSSGVIPLNIGNFTFKRKSPLFLKVQEGPSAHDIAISRYQTTLADPNQANVAQLSLEGRTQTSNLKYSLEKTPADQLLERPDIAGQGFGSLFVQGFSNITGLNSISYLRTAGLDSTNFIPASRDAFLFIRPEANCLTGSKYSLDGHTRDVSSDYNFALYASGHLFGSETVGPVVESGFYQTSSLFKQKPLIGSGVARFTGGQSSNLGNYSGTSNLYGGTILMQSGSPSQSDQHRITPGRRGVAASFWINQKRRRKQGFIKSFQGVMGNLNLGFTPSTPMSGEWGIYYVQSDMQASGTTPFNSFKDFEDSGSALQGIIPWANTTGGIENSTPDTMIPLNEDRWYYMMFWWDTKDKVSYCRVAAPSRGTPGTVGYKEAIDPITDKGQKWDGYEIIETRNKFKVGGDLFAHAGQSLPFNNLGYGVAADSDEEFLIDEISISNKVCTRKVMEDQFDLNYQYYTKQFIEQGNASLFIPGSSGVI